MQSDESYRSYQALAPEISCLTPLKLLWHQLWCHSVKSTPLPLYDGHLGDRICWTLHWCAAYLQIHECWAGKFIASLKTKDRLLHYFMRLRSSCHCYFQVRYSGVSGHYAWVTIEWIHYWILGPCMLTAVSKLTVPYHWGSTVSDVRGEGKWNTGDISWTDLCL